MKIIIDKEAEIAIIDMGEASDITALQKGIEALLDHPDHKNKMDTILDVSKANFASITTDIIEDYARWLVPRLPRLATRNAIVVKRDLEYGISRMWIVYADKIAPQERQIFREMSEAREWLIAKRD